MKKGILYFLLLLLILFLPAKTVDLIVDKEEINEKEEKEIEWVENPSKDSTKILETPKVIKPLNTSTSTDSNWWEYPKDIYPTKRNGNDLLVLVNKQYKLPSTYAPSDLVKSSNSGIRRGENYHLRNIIIPDLTRMVIDSKAEGIDLSIVSGYRSYQTQVNTYNYWLSKNDNNVALVDTFSARAGHSQHQLGTAIDFSSNEIGDRLGDEFENTKASKWLIANAYKYGFVISFPKGYESITGYKFESWHYRYIGIQYAREVSNRGLILELYLRENNP